MTKTESAKDRSLSSIVDKTLHVISMLKLAEKNYYSRDKIQFEIDEAKTLLELRLQYSLEVQRMLSGRMEVAEVTTQKLASAQKAFGSEAQLIDRKALEELSSSCLMEKQRLEWDAIAAELRIETDKRDLSTSRAVESARLRAKKLEVEGIEKKLAFAKKEYEETIKLIEQAATSMNEARKAEASYRELENQLKIALVNLEATVAGASHVEESSLEKTAIQQKSLGERMKLIESQLEKLAKQRTILSEVATIDQQIAFESSMLQDLKRQLQQAEAERMSYGILQKMLELALEKSKPSGEQPSKEADK